MTTKLTPEELARIAHVTSRLLNHKVFHGDWSNAQDMIKSFNEGEAALNDAVVLFAAYTYENYNGDAFVLFVRDGKLFEVNGSHCSCYDLENNWDPEETTIEAIEHRIQTGYGIVTAFSDEIRKALGEFEQT